LEKSQNDFDYIHLGHAHWCINNLEQAIESYKKAFVLLNNDMLKFKQYFDDDIDYLLKFGIKKLDISLMKDYISESVD